VRRRAGFDEEWFNAFSRNVEMIDGMTGKRGGGVLLEIWALREKVRWMQVDAKWAEEVETALRRLVAETPQGLGLGEIVDATVRMIRV
jgi:hypothetical protein